MKRFVPPAILLLLVFACGKKRSPCQKHHPLLQRRQPLKRNKAPLPRLGWRRTINTHGGNNTQH